MKLLIISIFASIPASIIFTFLLNPLLGKLEPLLGINLVDRHGPVDWIFVVNWLVIALLVFLFFKKISNKSV